MADNGKKTRGRQKVEIVRMQNDSNRLVTFSKRRAGLFKKASELCTLCGVDAAIIVFSPGRKAFSFGHPSVDATLNRFLFADTVYDPNVHHGQTSEPQDYTNVLRSNMHLTAIGEQIELAKKRCEELLNERKQRKEEFEWLNLIEKSDSRGLKSLYESLSPLKDTVAHLYSAFCMEVRNANGLPLTVPNALGSTYQVPPDMEGGQNPLSPVYGGLPYQMAMVPTPLVGGPSNYDHSQLMMEHTPIGGFGDPSLTMAQNDMAIDHLNANTNALSCLSNPIEFNFPTQNLLTSFQGENNSIGSQFEGLAPLAPMGMGFNPGPVDFQNFASSSSMSGASDMNANGQVAPFTFQDGFAFDNDGFGFNNTGFH